MANGNCGTVPGRQSAKKIFVGSGGLYYEVGRSRVVSKNFSFSGLEVHLETNMPVWFTQGDRD